jgi:hypothetical protein
MEKFISGIQHKHPGAVTMLIMDVFNHNMEIFSSLKSTVVLNILFFLYGHLTLKMESSKLCKWLKTILFLLRRVTARAFGQRDRRNPAQKEN